MIAASILFIATYVLMLIFSKYRPWIALGSALLFLATGMLPLSALKDAVNFNVLMMLTGTMGIVALMIDSKMPARIADVIVDKVPNVKWAILTLSLFAGLVSAFIDNVATVLMIAPIALEIAKRQKLDPTFMIIAIAVSSNLQGAATLVGDTTSIMLGGYTSMNFLDFFVYRGRPGIFFAVELGALMSCLILWFMLRKNKQRISLSEKTEVDGYFPSVLMLCVVLLLILASLLPNMPELINGYICMGLMLIGLLYQVLRKKSLKAALPLLKQIDLSTLLLLASLFVVVAGISNMGVVDAICSLFTKLGDGNLFVIYTIIVWMSVLMSAFIDNIPYVAAMLPVTQAIAQSMGVDPTILYFGLLSGATLGGNLTPIGASANIAGIGILRKNGYPVKNKDFLKIGIPFTLAAILPAYLYFWFFYA